MELELRKHIGTALNEIIFRAIFIFSRKYYYNVIPILIFNCTIQRR